MNPELKICRLSSLSSENLPSPKSFQTKMPALPHQLEFVQESRKQITRILEGQDPRLLLIVGPCSIHDVHAAKEYAEKIRNLSEDVSQDFFIAMRTHFEKPRTALGWKGMLYDPHLDGSYDIASGIRCARQLLLDLAEMQVPAATEFLDPASPSYLNDLISWSCIGARTSESQVHRQLASGLQMPVAFKNNTSGNINIAVKGVLTAVCPHAYFGIDEFGHISVIRTQGNPYAHIVLRGGDKKTNYDKHSLKKAVALLKKNGLPERLVIDCSHGNSGHCHEKQKSVFDSVIQQYLDGNSAIRGLVLESNIFAGNQSLPKDKSQLQYAVSLTDSCLDWKATESLISESALLLNKKRLQASLFP